MWCVLCTSLTHQKTVASEVVVPSAKASGRQYTGTYASNSFPDSADTHFDMSGVYYYLSAYLIVDLLNCFFKFLSATRSTLVTTVLYV